jgi:hypothetical protein
MGQPTDPAERVGRQRAALPVRVDHLDDVVGPGRHHAPSAGTGSASPVSLGTPAGGGAPPLVPREPLDSRHGAAWSYSSSVGM